MSTERIGFERNRVDLSTATNINRNQADLAVVIYNDLEQVVTIVRGRRSITYETLKRYFFEWEIKTLIFLDLHPEFEAEKIKLYLKL